jgi:putative transposase
MNSIIEQQGHKPFTINGISDHVHVLVSMNPMQSPSDLMYHVKRSSSLWANENRFVKGRFSWQEGFGAFSYGKSQIPDIIKYIDDQYKRHQKRTFREEYLEQLKAFDIEYNERFLFKPID